MPATQAPQKKVDNPKREFVLSFTGTGDFLFPLWISLMKESLCSQDATTH